MVRLQEFTYKIRSDIVRINGAIPLTYWTLEPNFGDLLSPWLINKLTDSPIQSVPIIRGSARKRRIIDFSRNKFSYFSIGSIISRTTDQSIVWGSGAFGTELDRDVKNNARYLSVRGPLTRNLLRIYGRRCPDVYGDPALLAPAVFHPEIKKLYEVGIVSRWSEDHRQGAVCDPEIKLINFGTQDVEGTIRELLACKRIASSSLHGIILADAYGIPSAWIKSDSPKGLEFKFYDYFLSVQKTQRPQQLSLIDGPAKARDILRMIEFHEDPIVFNPHPLLTACPFLERANGKALSGP